MVQIKGSGSRLLYFLGPNKCNHIRTKIEQCYWFSFCFFSSFGNQGQEDEQEARRLELQVMPALEL